MIREIDESVLLGDPTWTRALEAARNWINLPETATHLISQLWNNKADPASAMRTLPLSRLEFTVLGDDFNEIRSAVERDQQRPTAIRLITATLLQHFYERGGPHTNRIIKDTITSVEIGMAIAKVIEDFDEPAAGAIGLARALRWLYAPGIHKEEDWENRGYDAFQLSGCCVQQLGFGVAIAIGIGCVELFPAQVTIDESSQKVRALTRWIEALHLGRSYPGELAVRTKFKEIVPPQQGERNPLLETLYTLVGKITSKSPIQTSNMLTSKLKEILKDGSAA